MPFGHLDGEIAVFLYWPQHIHQDTTNNSKKLKILPHKMQHALMGTLYNAMIENLSVIQKPRMIRDPENTCGESHIGVKFNPSVFQDIADSFPEIWKTAILSVTDAEVTNDLVHD
jgi:hypothetical protein